jgi:CBS domain containing-hemolysin-like protein
MSWSLGPVVVAVVLVAVAGVVAAGEAALSRMSRVRAAELVRSGRAQGSALVTVTNEPARYVNLLTLIRVTCEVLATALVTSTLMSVLSSTAAAVAVSAAVMVLVSYVVVGVSPRTLGRQRADRVAPVTAALVVPLARILGPLPSALIALGNAVTPGRGFREGPFATEAELRELVDLAQESRVIEPDEREMIHSVFELGDRIVREVMVPRTDMVVIEADKTIRQALSLAFCSGFSRIPVIGQGEDDVRGVVYVKDLAAHVFRDPAAADRPVSTIMREAMFVPDTLGLSALLHQMQTANVHMAVVVDEYGGTAGLVTIEDILEEIVGEITDEYDTRHPTVEPLPDGTLRVSTRLPVDELSEIVGVDLPDEDIETVGGLLAKALGKVPIPGATAEVAGVTLRAEAGQGRRNRVATVLVARTPPPASTAEPAPGVERQAGPETHRRPDGQGRPDGRHAGSDDQQGGPDGHVRQVAASARSGQSGQAQETRDGHTRS